MNLHVFDNPTEIYRALVEHALEPMTVVHENGAITFENHAVERLVGQPFRERFGRSFFDFVHPGDFERVHDAFGRALIELAATPPLEFRVRHVDGRWLAIEAVMHFMKEHGTRVGLVHARDVGERQGLEARLRHAQKLSTVGRLTVSIADDVDATIGTIRSHLATLVSPDTSRPVPLGLRAIMKAADTAAALTRQLRAFCESAPAFHGVVDVHAVVNGIRERLGDGVWLNVSLAAERSVIHADHDSLEEALTDLVRSFLNAMPDGSVMAIATRTLAVPAGNVGAESGSFVDYIVIDITNTGRGVAVEIDAWLFEPSAVMPASGVIMLALVALHDTVSYVGGFVEVASTAGGGTIVRVFLPLDERQA